MQILQWIWKIILILPSVGAGLIGVIQALIKFAKEICTLALNILVPVFPNIQNIVIKVRDTINKIDDIFQVIKKWLLQFVGVKNVD
jgi:phage-related minor tail protein